MPISTECVLKSLRSGKFFIYYGPDTEYLGETSLLKEATVFADPAEAWSTFWCFVSRYSEIPAILPVIRSIDLVGDEMYR